MESSADAEGGCRSSTWILFVKYKDIPLEKFKVRNDEVIGNFKTLLESKLGISGDEDCESFVLGLLHNGKELQDEKTFNESEVNDCDWLLLLKRPKVSAKNLKLGQAAAAAISAAEPQSTGDNSRVVEAIRRLNSRAEMKRLSELLADLNRNVGIILTNNPTEARSSVLNSAEMMAPKIFDSLMRKKSLSYRISVLKRWINQIVLNELPQTMVNSHVEEMINIQYAVTEIRRAIDELSILDEISEGGSSNDGLRMQPNSMASELSRDSDQLANSPLIQASIIIPPSWALRTMINDEGAALDAFGDMRTLSREMDLADARTALVSLTREAVTNSMAPVEQIIVPESLFEVELAQLSEMGFHDTRTNIQALQLANGVVEEAVELLFEYFMRNAN